MNLFNAFLFSALLFSGNAFASTKHKASFDYDKDRSCLLEDTASAGVGDIKMSILSEAEFQKVHGAEWVLMKGQSQTDLEISSSEENVFSHLTSSNYSTTYLPHAGGAFFRSANTTGTPSGHENPYTAKLGEWQGDAFQGHIHTFKQEAGGAATAASPSVAIFGGNSVNVSANSNAINVPYTDGVNGTPRTASETRSKNITVNVFVKVKRACLDNVAMARIDALEAYNTKNVCDSCLTMPETTLAELHSKFTCFKNDIDLYEGSQKDWSVSCTARTVGNTKKVLMSIGTTNRTEDEDTYLNHLDNQYPYYNVIQFQ